MAHFIDEDVGHDARLPRVGSPNQQPPQSSLESRISGATQTSAPNRHFHTIPRWPKSSPALETVPPVSSMNVKGLLRMHRDRWTHVRCCSSHHIHM